MVRGLAHLPRAFLKTTLRTAHKVTPARFNLDGHEIFFVARSILQIDGLDVDNLKGVEHPGYPGLCPALPFLSPFLQRSKGNTRSQCIPVSGQAKLLDAPVILKQKKNKGKIEIPYGSLDELDRILSLIGLNRQEEE